MALLLVTLRGQAQDATDVSAGIESYRELTLPNGLRVVLAVDHRAPQVALHIEYAVGDALDPPDRRGLAQLIGAILPKLQTRHLHAAERPRLLQAAGFEYEEPGVQVGRDATWVTLQVPAEALELALWLEADRMGFAADGITQPALSDAVARVRDSVERAPNDFDADVVFRAALGRMHPYGALDRPANLSTVKAAFVAARLRRYYNPASAALVLVGDFDVKSAEAAVRRLFGPLPSAPLTPLRLANRDRGGAARLVSLAAPVPTCFSAVAWETPPWFAADDQGLDVIATVLWRRLTARKLCERTKVGQRSRRLTSVFVASCEGPTTSSDAWRSALVEELAALAEGRVPAAEIEGAALRYSVVAAERYDELSGRAQRIASSVLAGHGAQTVPLSLQDYLSTDAARIAAIVRRYLLKPADGRIEITPLAGAPRSGTPYFGGDTEPMFQVPAEAVASLPPASIDWPRPPANGAPHRFQPPTGPTDTLPNGDQLRFVERFGVPVAHAKLQIAWPALALNPAARPVLAELLKKSVVEGSTLEEKLHLLGAELAIYGPVDELEITLLAPVSRLSAAFDALATVLAEKELPKEGLAAAKGTTGDWTKLNRDQWDWYWDALGLSAPKSRYAYLKPSERRRAVAGLEPSDVARLWRLMAQQPRAIDLVGPFDTATARNLGAKLSRSSSAPAARPRPPERALFRPGVYLLDRAQPENGSKDTDGAASESIDVCVLWPLPRWASSGHYPAQLMPWFFLTDVSDGLGVRFIEHKARVPWWQSNTLLNRDEDFLRYSFRTSLDQLKPTLESVKDHLARLGEGNFSQSDFGNAIAAERQFQVRQSLSGQSMIYALHRAADHDRQANEALDMALQIERLAPKDLENLARSLKLDEATIGIMGPAARVTEALKAFGLKPTTVTELETPSASAGASQ